MYLTCDSVDLYFATIVAKLKVHPETVRRIHPALHFLPIMRNIVGMKGLLWIARQFKEH